MVFYPAHLMMVFGAKTAANGGEEERPRELAEAKMVDALNDDEAQEWARYVLNLFPNLNAETSLADCIFMSMASGWAEVLERVLDICRSQKGSGLGVATVAKSSEQ